MRLNGTGHESDDAAERLGNEQPTAALNRERPEPGVSTVEEAIIRL
jgi:hypothetical protein